MNELGHSDLLVLGGGTAGMAAAVSAARLGVKVTVVERWPMLGGLATMAAVNHWHTRFRTGFCCRIG
jgi:NADPH-dependent 2,4-dienoyl-CoA reductase/sulfur reductase-like enzyme